MLTIFGIPSCDSCRKARKWLDTKDVAYHFHDIRADGVDRKMLDRWLAAVSWKSLLNTRSTTWRALNDADKADVDQDRAVQLMLAHPTLIKRPVAEAGGSVIVGFSPDAYSALVA